MFNACWRDSVKPLQFYCSYLPASVLVHQRRILFWLKMVRSDNVILPTLAGCSRDSVVALLDKYSPIGSHYEPSMLSSCVVKRWFWLYFSNLCQAVWPTIHWLIDCMFYLYCFYYCFLNFFSFSFVYFYVHCTLCIFVFYNHCCLVRINKWMNEWMNSNYGRICSRLWDI